MQCPELNITHGKLSSKRKRAGEEITITCDEGYQLRGAAKVVCLKEGKWSEVPTCQSGKNLNVGMNGFPVHFQNSLSPVKLYTFLGLSSAYWSILQIMCQRLLNLITMCFENVP